MKKDYRTGAIGALMDEYERATTELKHLVEQVSDDNYALVIDTKTRDENCRSIQSILTHVVRAGYSYANYIRESFSIPSIHPSDRLVSRQEVAAQLDAMLDYTARTLDGKWEMPDEEIDSIVIHSRWGVTYNLEQLLEHAIVHILRHRRQVERFLANV
ncbi:MAG: DinB family protein [Blastocatellia bacterium]